MRKFALLALLALSMSTQSGCALPIFSADPAERATEMVFVSENLRMIREEWQRIWFLDQPSHMQPLRTHGGII